MIRLVFFCTLKPCRGGSRSSSQHSFTLHVCAPDFNLYCSTIQLHLLVENCHLMCACTPSSSCLSLGPELELSLAGARMYKQTQLNKLYELDDSIVLLPAAVKACRGIFTTVLLCISLATSWCVLSLHCSLQGYLAAHQIRSPSSAPQKLPLCQRETSIYSFPFSSCTK